jgi:hypothetical protein
MAPLDELIAALQHRLSPGDVGAGWTDALRHHWLSYFAGLREGIRSATGHEKAAASTHLVRWLARDGIQVLGSPLTGLATDVQRSLSEASIPAPVAPIAPAASPVLEGPASQEHPNRRPLEIQYGDAVVLHDFLRRACDASRGVHTDDPAVQQALWQLLGTIEREVIFWLTPLEYERLLASQRDEVGRGHG